MRQHTRHTMQWFLMALALAGCCTEESGGEQTDKGDVKLINDTSYWVHFVSAGSPTLYVAPGTATDTKLKNSGIQAIWAPGQGLSGSATIYADCCDDHCGTIRAFHPEGQDLELTMVKKGSCDYDPGTCDDDDDYYDDDGGDDGSCPYVYTHDGRRFVLEGEALVGALNRGARRTDVFALDRLRARRGQYRVRLAAVLRETDYIDRATLRVVDHPRSTRAITDSAGRLHLVSRGVRPTRAVDAAGRDVLRTLSRDDRRHWKGRNTKTTLWGDHRDWVELEFPRPRHPSRAALLVRGRNTQFIQDTYHRYMRQFGGGAHTVLDLLSGAPWYKAMLDVLMQQGAFGIDVAQHTGLLWEGRATMKPVGPAGMRTVVVPLALPTPGLLERADRVRLRLAVVPGGWEVDSVRLVERQPTTPHVTTVRPSTATLARRGSRGAAVELSTLRTAEGRSVRVPHDHHLTLTFPAPPRRRGRTRTVLLSVSGYYREHGPPLVERLDFRPLKTLESFLVPEHFTAFVLEALAKKGAKK